VSRGGAALPPEIAHIARDPLDSAFDDEAFVRRVRALVLRHEVGGGAEADVLQAADSLSFLETLSWLTAEWVTSGVYGRERAIEKLRWSVERIRLPDALAAALPLYDRAVSELEGPAPLDGASRRRLAGDAQFLLSRYADPYGSGALR
jgi:hypothetical protein